MISKILVQSTLILLAACCLWSCKKEVRKVFVMTKLSVDLYEERQLGAMLIPDTIRVYMVDRGSAYDRAKQVFEGEDVGAVCYDWVADNSLNINVSSGYVDSIAPFWSDKNGNHIYIRLVQDGHCKWHSPL